jgi:hypothetical protein
MKHIKMLGLAVMALAAFMALAGNASAAALTSPAGTEYTGELNATATSSLLLKAGFANITCTSSTVKGKVETNGATTAGGKISTLSFSNCGSAVVTTFKTGSLEIVSAGGGKGTVKGSGSEVTVGIPAFGVTCDYGTTASTTLGTLTGGTTATMTISANLPLISATGSFGCASPAAWSGTYSVTSPDTLLVD